LQNFDGHAAQAALHVTQCRFMLRKQRFMARSAASCCASSPIPRQFPALHFPQFSLSWLFSKLV
ncbi:MAG: hypothetical protein J6S21_05925, partial [Victivallales bacterium]|nr:hypothetical protein [Victivallales bacterium]